MNCLLFLSIALHLGPGSARAAVARLPAIAGAPAPVSIRPAALASPAPRIHAPIPALTPANAADLQTAAPAPIDPSPSAARSLETMAAEIPGPDTAAAATYDGSRPGAEASVPPQNPAVEALTKELLAVLLNTGGDPTKAESELIGVLARVHAAGQLNSVVQAIASDPRVAPLLPPMPVEKRVKFAAQFAFMAGAELEGAGKIPGTKPFESWEAMSKRQLALVAASAHAPRGPTSPSLFSEPSFVKEYAALTGSPFTSGNAAKPLIDGPASFAVRFALMRKAKKSLFVHSWAFYDDATGNAAADLLIAKKREGLDIKIMVDGKTAATHGSAVLARMAEAGVEIVFFHDAVRPYDGLHTKILLVDGIYALAGGMNHGDDYSHMGAGQKWRDTDILYRGPVVAQTARFMADLWNAQVRAQGVSHGRMNADVPSARAGGEARLSFLADGPEGEATIMLAYLKAIAGASRVINIENAYVITTPALRTALFDALRRGVKINLLTNSGESVDEPIVTAPILASLPELIKAGANVFLKRGSTLHSKFMTIDGLFSIIGSFNLHPRSIRYEHEMIISALDARVAADLDRAFVADIAAARHAADPVSLAIPDSALTRLVRRYFFNQL